jgi:hypothetical protein
MIQYKEPIIYPNHSIDNSEDLDIEIEYEHDINKKIIINGPIVNSNIFPTKNGDIQLHIIRFN